MPTTLNKVHLQPAIATAAKLMFPNASTLIEALDELYLFYRRKAAGNEADEATLKILLISIMETKQELIRRSVELERQVTPQQTPTFNIPFTFSEN